MSEEKIKCPKCGTGNDSSNKFCEECGTAMDKKIFIKNKQSNHKANSTTLIIKTLIFVIIPVSIACIFMSGHGDIDGLALYFHMLSFFVLAASAAVNYLVITSKYSLENKISQVLARLDELENK